MGAMKSKLTVKNYTTIAASTLVLSAAIATSTIAGEDPLCYIQNRDGRQVDLSKLCDRPKSPTHPTSMSQPAGAENPAAATGNPRQTLKPAETPPIGKIDPNAPVTNPVIRSNTPPPFWNSIPDLPSPPAKGRTTDSVSHE